MDSSQCKGSKDYAATTCLAELKEHLSTHANDNHLSNTIQHLEACNKLFENGFLSHNKITSQDRSVIVSFDEGFWFFVGWCDDAILNNVVIERDDQKRSYHGRPGTASVSLIMALKTLFPVSSQTCLC